MATDVITDTKNELNVLTHEDGDLTFKWDEDNETEVNLARQAFADAKAKGYFAYSVVKVDGEKERILIKEFDASLEKIVMTPQLVGG